MILDYLDPSAPTDLQADLCIIGAGAAGIAIARSFIGSSFTICLVEGGGTRGEERSQALYEGSACGDVPFDTAGSRMRVFGGSCTLWGGGCLPLGDSDMTPRDWVPDSGWPLRREALEQWYDKAREFCRIDPAHGFTDGTFDGPPPRKPLDLDPEVMTNYVFARSPVVFGDAYRDILAHAANVTVLLHANLLELRSNDTASHVTEARIGSLDGRRGRVRARHYVLAAGGIENARLLLLSDGIAAGGLGNTHDLVGRYFMDHPSGALGMVRSEHADRLSRPYERSIGKERAALSAEIGLSTAAQCRHRTLNGRVHPFAIEGEVPRGIKALRNLRASLRKPARDEGTLLEARLNAALQNGPGHAALASPPHAALEALRLGLHFGDVVRALVQKAGDRPVVRSESVALVGFFEQAPNRDSRITLDTRRDALGLRRVRVDWRLTDLDRHTYRALTRLTGDRLAAACQGRFEPASWAVDTDLPVEVHGTAHHMGTTRMANDPAHGVVDPACKVFGVGNLHVAGSSVFPTGGWAFPTFTLIALSLRLADRLRILLQACESGGLS